MTDERAQQTLRRIELEGKVVGIEPAAGLRDQDAQRMCAKDAVQFARLSDGEVGRDVHGGKWQ